jgi:hypothetical protein
MFGLVQIDDIKFCISLSPVSFTDELQAHHWTQ